MWIVARSNALIDLSEPAFELVFEFAEMGSNWLFQQRQARAGNQVVFVLPGLIIHEIIFETSVSDAIAAIDVTGFKALTQQAISQELITIDKQLAVSIPTGGIQVAFGRVRDDTQGECPSRILAERASFRKSVFEKLYRFE